MSHMSESCHIWVLGTVDFPAPYWDNVSEESKKLVVDMLVIDHKVWSCSVLQCVAVCCSVLQCVAACCSVLQRAAVYCSVLQCVAACCSVLHCVAAILLSRCSSSIPGCCVAVYCSVLQCVTVSCSVLQYMPAIRFTT